MDLHEEAKIIQNFHAHPEVFGDIFDAYYPTIFQYILRRVGEIEIAEDIVSEVFLKALRGISKFEFRNISICHWLYKISSNEISLYYKKGEHYSDSLEEMFASHGFDPKSDDDIIGEILAREKELEQQQDFQRSQKILATLPIKYQEVIALRFLEEKSIRDISIIMDSPEGTIKSLISRGLEKLRGALLHEEVQPNSPSSLISYEAFLPQ